MLTATLNETDLNNALVEQKDSLRNMMLLASDAEGFETSEATLNLLAPFWKVVGYGCKAFELRRWLREAVNAKLYAELEEQGHYRRGTSLWNVTRRQIERLTALSERLGQGE